MSKLVNIKRIRRDRRGRAGGHEVSYCGLVSLSSGDFMHREMEGIIQRMQQGGSRVFDADGNEMTVDNMRNFFKSASSFGG